MHVRFERAKATLYELSFNTDMSSRRISVEWIYTDIKQQWATKDLARILRVCKSPISFFIKRLPFTLTFAHGYIMEGK